MPKDIPELLWGVQKDIKPDDAQRVGCAYCAGEAPQVIYYFNGTSVCQVHLAELKAAAL